MLNFGFRLCITKPCNFRVCKLLYPQTENKTAKKQRNPKQWSLLAVFNEASGFLKEGLSCFSNWKACHLNKWLDCIMTNWTKLMKLQKYLVRKTLQIFYKWNILSGKGSLKNEQKLWSQTLLPTPWHIITWMETNI